MNEIDDIRPTKYANDSRFTQCFYDGSRTGEEF